MVSKTAADVWAHGLPDWITLDIAAEATRRFFTEPADNGKDSPYFTSRHLVFHAQKVRREFKENQKLLALEERMSLAHLPDRKTISRDSTPQDGRVRSLRQALESFGRDNKKEAKQ